MRGRLRRKAPRLSFGLAARLWDRRSPPRHQTRPTAQKGPSPTHRAARAPQTGDCGERRAGWSAGQKGARGTRAVPAQQPDLDRGGPQRRRLDGITDARDSSLRKLPEAVMGREAWPAAVHGDAENRTR